MTADVTLPADPGVAALLDRLERGERGALARLLTVVEDGPSDLVRQVILRLYPRTGQARIIGVTGSPGVGKSTLTSAIAGELRARRRRVAVLAVDPSSPFSGGALLGDRIRMRDHHSDQGVYIRSMASRGHLGGLSLAAPHAINVLDAAGFDDVIVESVGVGQSEVEIAGTADTTIVALAPGAGDRVQAAKAGILEVADIFVVNKADHTGAGKLVSELKGMMEIGHASMSSGATPGDVEGPQWWPPIVRTVAVRPEGLVELVEAIDEHGAHLRSSGRDTLRVRARALHTLRETALDSVRQRFLHLDERRDALLEELADRVATRVMDPFSAVDALVDAHADRTLDPQSP